MRKEKRAEGEMLKVVLPVVFSLLLPLSSLLHKKYEL
jgi:hypothetical protein